MKKIQRCTKCWQGQFFGLRREISVLGEQQIRAVIFRQALRNYALKNDP
ncbi:hypothetical protein DSUL_100227 [Desulfovibrionales bacterium]